MRDFRVVPSRPDQRLPVILCIGFMQSVKICRLNIDVKVTFYCCYYFYFTFSKINRIDHYIKFLKSPNFFGVLSYIIIN